MSYWVKLEYEGDVCGTTPHCEGGTIQVGGSDEALMNVTYNYGKVWSVRKINGMTGEQSVPILEAVVRENGTERDDDYWNPTPGNVGYMASVLHAWALQHPQAVWRVT